MIRRRALVPGLVLGLVGPLGASAQAQGTHSRQHIIGAPSDAITADLGFAKAARDKGLFTAMRDTAVSDAEVVWIGLGGPRPVAPLALRQGHDAQPAPSDTLPQPQRLADFIKSHEAPATTPPWHVSAAWMSCDASTAVTAGQHGDNRYLTVWQRQKRGDYKWVLLVEGKTTGPSALDAGQDMIPARLTDCPARTKGAGMTPPTAAKPVAPPLAPADYLSGASKDETLRWECPPNYLHLQPFTLSAKIGGALQQELSLVLVDGVVHPPAVTAPPVLRR